MNRDAGWTIRRNRFIKSIVGFAAAVLVVIVSAKIVELLDESHELEPVHADNGWVVGISNPSGDNRPIRRARLALLSGTTPIAGAPMDHLGLNFRSTHLTDDATYEMLITGKQIGAKREEVLIVTVRHPKLRRPAFKGRLTLWYGSPRDKRKIVLEPVFISVSR